MTSALSKIDEAIASLNLALPVLHEIQKACSPGGVIPSPGDQEAFNLYQLWCKLEKLADKIHEALAALGD